MKKNKKNIITKKNIKRLIYEIKIIQRRMIDLINKDELSITEFLEVKEKYAEYITFIYILLLYFDYKFVDKDTNKMRMVEAYLLNTQRKLEERFK